jgi:hypothetical protein
MTNLVIVGAGGNMGTRVGKTLARFPEKYRLLYVENGELGRRRLAERGLSPTSPGEALPQADAVVLAVADKAIKAVAAEIVPLVKSGTLVITLDPAAPYAGHLPERPDVSYFVTHPAHPPVFNDEVGEARRDFFGSGLAKQSIVSALMQGPEGDFARGEAIARDMFGPILRSHRVTVEQMAMLEPAMSETVAATCITVIKEAMDEVIKRGVPAEAARDFMLGHVNIPLAIVFGEIEWDFSAGAKLMIEEAKKEIFQPDWKKVFELDHLRKSVKKITGT